MDLITTAAAVYPVPETAVVYPTTAWMGTERGIAAPVPLVQYDDTLPILVVALRLNGQPYTVPEGAAVNIRMDKRDGHYVYNPALGVSEDRHTAYIGVTLQMTTGAGEYWPTIEIVIDGQVAGTSYVPLLIAENPVPEDAIESTDEYKTIQQLAAEVTQAAKDVTDNLPAINAIEENIDNINAVAQNSANISAVGGSIANVNTVAENLTPIQTAATNIAAIQQAPQQAANAAASATLSESWAVGGTGTREGEDTNNAQYWCNQAQTVAQGALGWYESESALQAAHPTGQNGQWAIIGTTDTIWTWDEDTGAWVDTGAQIDLSNYYTKAQTDAQIKTAMSNTGTLVSGSSVTTGTVNNGGVGTIGTLKIPSAGVWMVAASGWKPDAISKGIVNIDNIGGCSLSEFQFCLAGVRRYNGATTLNLNVTNWSDNTVNGQQSAGLIFRAVKISG